MNLFKAKLITVIIAFGFITSALVGAGLYHFVPTFDWNWFVSIILFFLVLEPLFISYVEGVSRGQKTKLVNAYMLTKVIKVILSLFFVLIYMFLVKENVKIFAIVFMLFYFLYLAMEAILFIKIEKHIKSNIDN